MCLSARYTIEPHSARPRQHTPPNIDYTAGLKNVQRLPSLRTSASGGVASPGGARICKRRGGHERGVKPVHAAACTLCVDTRPVWAGRGKDAPGLHNQARLRQSHTALQRQPANVGTLCLRPASNCRPPRQSVCTHAPLDCALHNSCAPRMRSHNILPVSCYSRSNSTVMSSQGQVKSQGQTDSQQAG